MAVLPSATHHPNAQVATMLSEQDAYRFIQAAYVANRIDFQIDLARLAKAGSPVHSAKTVLAPSLLVMLTCMAVLLAALGGYVSFLVAVGTMIAAMLAQVFLVRSWVIYRVQRRTMTALLTKLGYWKALWRFGGIAISLSGTPSVRCVSPDGDWRSFVMTHLTDLGQHPMADPSLSTPAGEDLQ